MKHSVLFGLGLGAVAVVSLGIGYQCNRHWIKIIMFSRNFNKKSVPGHNDINTAIYKKKYEDLDRILKSVQQFNESKYLVPRYFESYLQPIQYNARLLMDRAMESNDAMALGILAKYNNGLIDLRDLSNIRKLIKCSVHCFETMYRRENKTDVDYCHLIDNDPELVLVINKIRCQDFETFKYIVCKNPLIIEQLTDSASDNLVDIETLDMLIGNKIMTASFINKFTFVSLIKLSMDQREDLSIPDFYYYLGVLYNYYQDLDLSKKKDILFNTVQILEYFKYNDIHRHNHENEKSYLDYVIIRSILDLLTHCIDDFSFIGMNYNGVHSMVILDYFITKGLQCNTMNQDGESIVFCVTAQMYKWLYGGDEYKTYYENVKHCVDLLQSLGHTIAPGQQNIYKWTAEQVGSNLMSRTISNNLIFREITVS